MKESFPEIDCVSVTVEEAVDPEFMVLKEDSNRDSSSNGWLLAFKKISPIGGAEVVLHLRGW